MTVPGSNLLKRAFNLIARQSFDYYPYVSRTLTSNKLYKATYGQARHLKGSVQPVSRKLYEAMHLDFQKNYYNIYVPTDVIDVRRDVSGDYFVFNGMKLQAESITAWYQMDGWVAVLTVQVQS